LVGAGWDKKGWAVNGLYALGFAGVEVGTVPLFGQPGNKKPRMEMVTKGVGRNWLGFNSPGSEAVERYLDNQGEIDGVVGINIGLNKEMPHERSPWAHAAVVPKLYPYADYFVFNPASPNTPELRELQREQPVRDHIKALQEAMEEQGGQKPLYVKLAPDVTGEVFEGATRAATEEGASGLVLANTTLRPYIKQMYGLSQDAPGGISGDNAMYRATVLRMIYQAYEEAGDKLDIIASGAVVNHVHALEHIFAGASAVQVVTGIRTRWGKTAAEINKGMLEWCTDHHVNNVTELIGAATQRGAKYPQAA
jgi:dihydroorotate dehydrogenase